MLNRQFPLKCYLCNYDKILLLKKKSYNSIIKNIIKSRNYLYSNSIWVLIIERGCFYCNENNIWLLSLFDYSLLLLLKLLELLLLLLLPSLLLLNFFIEELVTLMQHGNCTQYNNKLIMPGWSL